MPVAQEVIDQQVIAATLGEIQAYANQADDRRWELASQQNTDYVNNLLDTYAPDMPRLAGRLNALVAGSILAFAEEKYGTSEMQPKLYGGSVESDVIATYHHAGHPRAVLQDMFRYAARRNQDQPDTFTVSQLARFPIMASAHDIVMGNGRGHDERQSALVAAELMMRTAISLAPDKHTTVAIEATTWDPHKHKQAVNGRLGYLPSQQAICVADLMPLCDRRGPYMAVSLAAEDFSKVRHGQILSKEAKLAGVSLVGASVDKCMQLIDERGPLQESFQKFLAGQSRFFADYKPADPHLDQYFTGRPANISFMNQLHQDVRSGAVSALGALTRAREYMLT